MDLATAVRHAKEIATGVLAPSAVENDRGGTFSAEAVDALGRAGLLGLTVPKEHGGAGLGLRAVVEVSTALAEVDASVAMVFLMHLAATACLIAAPTKTARIEKALGEIAAGKHLTTLAFSEKGSRSHFWAPLSKATKTPNGIKINASKSFVTSAGKATSYVVTTLSHAGAGATDSTLYLIDATDPGVSVSASWDGLGLRANASSPMQFECQVTDDARLTDEGGGFKAKLEVVLPIFNLGESAVSLGLCRAAVAASIDHLRAAKFEHLGGASLGESLPTLRAALASMQIETDGLGAFIDDCLRHIEAPGPLTMLRVLESKAAAGESAIRVTSAAMRICGGAAFSKQTGIERFFRDAHACAVMAPTGDVLHEFLGKAMLGLPLF